MKLYRFFILKAKDVKDYKDYEAKFVFAANQKEAKQKARKYVSVYRKRSGLPFVKVSPDYFCAVCSVQYYEYVFKNWDGSIHADEDGIITIGEALL